MKHYLTPRCKFECRFLQISDGLWLCPHAAYGEASYYKGAVDEGRAMLDKAGGYDAVLAQVMAKEEMVRTAAKLRREAKQKRLADSVRYK